MGNGASGGGVRAFNWSKAQRFALFLFGAIGAFTVLSAVYFSLAVPIGISAFFAYLLMPLVDYCERNNAPRWLASLAIVVSVVGLVIFATARIAPVLYEQARLLVQLVPEAVNKVLSVWVPIVENFVVDLGIMGKDEVHAHVTNFNLVSRLGSQLEAALTGLWTAGTSVLGGVLNVALIPFVTFFLLKDYPGLATYMRRLVPRDLLAGVAMLTHKVSVTLRTVIKGQVTVAMILAVLYVIGLSFVGLQSAIAIGLVAGVCRVIPYLDVLVGAVLSLIVILSEFQGWGQVLSVALVFLTVQAVDGIFITPRVIGERVGLHPLIVILSVIAIADWLGFWGVLLAVPLVAIAKALVETALPYYQASRLYNAGSVEQRLLFDEVLDAEDDGKPKDGPSL